MGNKWDNTATLPTKAEIKKKKKLLLVGMSLNFRYDAVTTYWGKPVLFLIVDPRNIMYITHVILIVFLSCSLACKQQNFERTAIPQLSY